MDIVDPKLWIVWVLNEKCKWRPLSVPFGDKSEAKEWASHVNASTKIRKMRD